MFFGPLLSYFLRDQQFLVIAYFFSGVFSFLTCLGKHWNDTLANAFFTAGHWSAIVYNVFFQTDDVI